MMKLLLLIMMFAFGTSTVSAEEDTTSTEDRISELAEINSDSQSTIKDKVDELSEYELETIIANVDELTEPTEEDLAIKEAAVSKLEEMKKVKTLSPVALLVIGVIGIILMYSSCHMGFKGYDVVALLTLIPGVVMVSLMMGSLMILFIK